jgi:hypothetical protein
MALSLLPAALLGQEPANVAKDMAMAANAWLDSLTAPQRQQAVFAVAHTERENWHYVPRSRRGVSLGQMNDDQRGAARKLLAAGLSERGCLQVEAIIALENVLRVVEDSARRDPQLYFFTIFGVPGAAGPWGWRVEGHHLSINFTLAAGRIAATPQFFGANPAQVRIPHEQTGRRALRQEEDSGRALAASFTPEQRQVAFIADQAPSEIITGNDRQVTAGTPAGLPYARMTSPQQAALRDLVAVYAGRLRTETAQAELDLIAADGWDAVHFAWAGSLSAGEAHYYRIQGPAFLIEYDNTQDRANHIHTVWRSFAGDFGRDLLRDHYQKGHSARR